MMTEMSLRSAPRSAPLKPPPRRFDTPIGIKIEAVPHAHPLRAMADNYSLLRARKPPQFLPECDDVLSESKHQWVEYSIVALPIASEPYLDFVVLRRGQLIPGDHDKFVTGECYASQIAPEHVHGRLLELAACMAIKQPRFSEGYSARHGALNVRVYRAIFPIWIPYMNQNAVILSIWPRYLEHRSDG